MTDCVCVYNYYNLVMPIDLNSYHYSILSQHKKTRFYRLLHLSQYYDRASGFKFSPQRKTTTKFCKNLSSADDVANTRKEKKITTAFGVSRN